METFSEEKIDAVDFGILERLSRDGRATWADLADELGLTAPAVAQRVRRLVERGVIRDFVARIAPTVFAPVSAFVELSLEDAGEHARFRKAVESLDAVEECHRIASSHHYLLKVRARDAAHLDRIVSTELPKLAKSARASVATVLGTVKEAAFRPGKGD